MMLQEIKYRFEPHINFRALRLNYSEGNGGKFTVCWLD